MAHVRPAHFVDAGTLRLQEASIEERNLDAGLDGQSQFVARQLHHQPALGAVQGNARELHDWQHHRQRLDGRYAVRAATCEGQHVQKRHEMAAPRFQIPDQPSERGQTPDDIRRPMQLE